MDIDILCKVVDNFGDIGVVYRLARALSALPEFPRLRLIVDDLAAFAVLEPALDPSRERQLLRGWEVYCWELSPSAIADFASRPTRILLQCFACPRPDWLENLLFDPVAPKSLMVDLDYLTAEAYAAEFHKMPSLTRSAKVAKLMFHPGFAPGTGGLIVDPAFAAARAKAASPEGRAELRRELLGLPALRAAGGTELSPAAAQAVLGTELSPESAFWILVFSYERDYTRIVADLAAFHENLRSGDRPQPAGLLALVAAGKSRDCFLAAWRTAGEPFPVLDLPFLPQETWDRLLLACDFSIVRGEDSWSRAALSGRPFLWQAYPQDGRYQMVKVEAFLERLCPYFPEADFAPLAAAYRAFNDRDLDAPDVAGGESILPLLEGYEALLPAFRAFSGDIAATGDLAANLVTFLREIV